MMPSTPIALSRSIKRASSTVAQSAAEWSVVPPEEPASPEVPALREGFAAAEAASTALRTAAASAVWATPLIGPDDSAGGLRQRQRV